MTKFDFNWKLIAMVTIPLAIIMLVFENKQNSKFDLQEKVYKILTQDEWEISKENGFIETSLDQKDGFVHLSTANQITGTLFYYFKYDETLMLIEYNSSELGEKLIFEDPVPTGSRSGQFPHYYSKLSVKKISNYWEIKRGAYSLPEEIILDIENQSTKE
tara:strand:+ start:6161 stop:6640 length:480 start_codon:yes stop_codon:yes gene_type:complete